MSRVKILGLVAACSWRVWAALIGVGAITLFDDEVFINFYDFWRWKSVARVSLLW